MSEGSCWLHHLPQFACVYLPYNRKWQEANQKVQGSRPARACGQTRSRGSRERLAPGGLHGAGSAPVTPGGVLYWHPGKLAACSARSVTLLVASLVPQARCWGV